MFRDIQIIVKPYFLKTRKQKPKIRIVMTSGRKTGKTMEESIVS